MYCADFGEREAELRVVRRAVAADPAELGMGLGELARPAPAVVVFVDRGPGVDLQADLVAVLDRGGEAVELGVVDRVELLEDLGGAARA